MFIRSVALMALTTLLALAGASLLGEPFRVGVLTGAVTAAIGSAAALALLKLGFDRGIKHVLATLAAGMFLRMLLVAAGLLVARAVDADLLAFSAGFFGLYLVHQLIEIAMVARHTRSRQAEGKT